MMNSSRSLRLNFYFLLIFIVHKSFNKIVVLRDVNYWYIEYYPIAVLQMYRITFEYICNLHLLFFEYNCNYKCNFCNFNIKINLITFLFW